VSAPTGSDEVFATGVWVPCGIERAFAFFADPANLDALTPRWFELRLPGGELPSLDAVAGGALAAGAEIAYRLRYRGLPLRWTSRIVGWRPPHFFSYEQRRGPYARFLHEHHFEARSSSDGRVGTWTTDRVLYRAPLHALSRRLVARELAAIFEFRRRSIESADSNFFAEG
jgi:ligand-binding SRPBCC domain-containing protein